MTIAEVGFKRYVVKSRVFGVIDAKATKMTLVPAAMTPVHPVLLGRPEVRCRRTTWSDPWWSDHLNVHGSSLYGASAMGTRLAFVLSRRAASRRTASRRMASRRAATILCASCNGWTFCNRLLHGFHRRLLTSLILCQQLSAAFQSFQSHLDFHQLLFLVIHGRL